MLSNHSLFSPSRNSHRFWRWRVYWAQIQKHLSDNRREVVHCGIKMAVFGPRNAGKSKIFNFLGDLFAVSLFIWPPCIVIRSASIVILILGTTRDVLELTLDIGGLPVVVVDTTGSKETDDLVEGIVVCRVRQFFFHTLLLDFTDECMSLVFKRGRSAFRAPPYLKSSRTSIVLVIFTSTGLPIPPIIQPLITPHTILTNPICYILLLTISADSSFFIFPHPNAPSHKVTKVNHIQPI